MQQISAPRRWFTRAGLAVTVLAVGLTATPVAASADEQVPGAPSIRVMPLGDSLTAGVGSTAGGGYRAELRAALAATGTKLDFVGSQRRGPGPDADHEGHPGWRTDQIAADLDGLLTTEQPDVVLLDIGTNDLLRDFAVAQAPARTAALIDQITRRLPSVRVVVAKLLVVPRDAAEFTAFNAALGGIVAARGPRVSLADMSRIPAVNTVDNVHPTDAGYRQMAYQWYQALRPVLTEAPAWPVLGSPFPLPVVSAVVARGSAVTVTARLRGRLTSVDLARVPVRLSYRQDGSDRWVPVGAAVTNAAGVVTFNPRSLRPGYFTVTVAAGPAAGSHSPPVRLS